jgi:oligopeptide transport system substrate-binding protein
MEGNPASFGYWVRRRRIALDLTRDALARRVGCSPSAVKKIERDERRPSRTMAQRLADALGLPPDQRERFLAAVLGEASVQRLTGTASDQDQGSAPPWLVRSSAAELGPVVGRESELAWLQFHLSTVLGGRSRVVFVVGEAGMGKTALLSEFADRACGDVPDLVVTRGAGTAAGALGDPYFPIRDAFRMLVADRHAPLQVDHLTRRQAESLWSFSATVAHAVVESGPRLLDVLVPVETVSERLGMSVAAPALADALQTDVSDQVSMVLRDLAERRPLLLMLDDMQWSDTASAELVFHLIRTLAEARVLVICAYRGSEVMDARGGAQGVLRKATLESGRDVDNSLLDLDAIDSTAERALCDALLDVETPDLDEAVRDEFYRRTHGHPLLVRQLVHELKARGDLVRRDNDSWAARPGVNWERVPARVAAVIEQRLDRLDADERALLNAAAVEGEYFTVEVAARVAGVDIRDAHRLLAERLARVHGLVREDIAGPLRGQSLTRYRFGHALFQSFIRARIGRGARAHAHGLVAAELEALHSDDLEPVVPQLADHYAQAGDADRAVPYLIQTGDRARLLQARDEAVAAYGRAVELLRERGDTERLAGVLMRIGLTYQTSFDHKGAQRAFDEAFALRPAADDSRSEGAVGSATLRLAAVEPVWLDPHLNATSSDVNQLLFSGLVQYDAGANIVPDVAERWDISSDGRRYTFRLRDDVIWSDGVLVTAHDFVFAYRRALDPARTIVELADILLLPVAGARDVFEGRAPAHQVAIQAVDDRTLVIELAEPTSYFMYNLAHSTLVPLPRHLVQAHGLAWCQPETIVSNGAFRLETWEPGRGMTLERNPRYHGPVSGNVQHLSLKFTARFDSSHEQLYQADEIDVLAVSLGTDAGVIDRLRRRSPHEHVIRPASAIRFYYLDPDAPPLDDRRVRQAMAMAVDRDLLAAKAGSQFVAATGGLVPPGIPGHVPGISTPHDPDRAARLISEVVGGDTPPLTIIGLEWAEPVVQHLVDQWRAVGLPVEIQLCRSHFDQFRAWDATSGPRIGLLGWVADYPDPDTFLRVAVNDYFLPSWRHGRYESVLEKAALTSDLAGRLDLYRMAELVLAEEAVLVPLLYQAEHLMVKPWVTRLPSLPFLYAGLKDVVIGLHGDEKG